MATDFKNITFQEGAPISASQLQDLVTYVNEINSNAAQFAGTFGTLADKAISRKMVAGTWPVGTVDVSKAGHPVRINFTPPLTAEPATVQITLETASTDSELIHFIQSGTASATGVTVWITRAANGVGSAVVKPTSVTLHYFAVAKSG